LPRSVDMMICERREKNPTRGYDFSWRNALREALGETTIVGYQVPKGATLFISPYTLHRRPEYFPQPEVFDPERFSPAREKQLPRYAYIPFGAGARVSASSPVSRLSLIQSIISLCAPAAE
jgi:cytochrome P450